MSECTKAALEQRVTELVNTSDGNGMTVFGGMRMYDVPIFGYASAQDPLFDEFLKPEVVGSGFIKPEEWLEGAKTVISYFLPFTKEVRDTNRAAGLPSEEWVTARVDGEVFNNEVRAFLSAQLALFGEKAVAPALDARFAVIKRVANWSERHVAYAAGLGTFGLHRALITAKGTAGRIGSVVTTLALSPTPRPYSRYDEYCLFQSRGTCGACMRRCPPRAISKSGKDHDLCDGYIKRSILPLWAPRYGCAKCNIGVPCEYENPMA